MTRPTKLTPEVIDAFSKAIQLGAPRALAAQFAGISARSAYRWLKEGETAPEGSLVWQFWHSTKRAEGVGCVTLLGRIQQAAKNGSWQAAAWILERRHPGEFGRAEARVITITDARSARDELEGFEDMTGEEQRAALEAALGWE